jgi:FixJ family two-component response regulator
MTNRAIAQSLFVTQHTVETHLGHVYQKLGHSSRERLQEQLSRQVDRRADNLRAGPRGLVLEAVVSPDAFETPAGAG